MLKKNLYRGLAGLLLGLYPGLPLQAQSSQEALTRQNPFVLLAAEPVCAQSSLALLCQGYLAAALNRLPEAERLLSTWLEAPGDPQWVLPAQIKLASVLILQGKFRRGADQYRGLLTLPLPDEARTSLQNAVRLFGAFQDLPVMQISAPPGQYPLSWDVHGRPQVSVQGERGQPLAALLDTGANLSTVSRSAARALGLTPLKGSVRIGDSVGQSVEAVLAYAPSLRMGQVELKNIPFLVLDDRALRYEDYQIQLILGLPVMLQLGRLELCRSGSLVLGASAPAGEPTLFLDQFNLAVRTTWNHLPIDLMLDTGARRSELGAGFEARVGSAWAAFKPEMASETAGGAGGLVTSQVTRLHGLTLTLDQQSLVWDAISLYPEAIAQGRLLGVLGQDMLANTGKGFVLDFKRMRLEWL